MKKNNSKNNNFELKINDMYLDESIKLEMQNVFEEEAFIQLNNFFLNDIKKLRKLISNESFILNYKPQFYRYEEFNIKTCYKPEVLKLYEFFKSKIFLDFLEDILQFEVNIKSIKLHKYSHRDYTILNDKTKREDIIEVFYDLSDEFEVEMGGTLTYLTKEEEIYYMEAKFNTLTIFFKPSEVMKYLKYINNKSLYSPKNGKSLERKNREILRFEIEMDINEF
ncbi:MAG: hypothetical protein KC589_09435 [Nanoarchaeota archaeon]|nr:hypothetical protein [Nanoarchaeota archaeon]